MNEITLLTEALECLKLRLKVAKETRDTVQRKLEKLVVEANAAENYVSELSNQVDTVKASLETLDKLKINFKDPPITIELEVPPPKLVKKAVEDVKVDQHKPVEPPPTPQTPKQAFGEKLLELLVDGKGHRISALTKALGLTEDGFYSLLTIVRKQLEDEGNYRLLTSGNGSLKLRSLDEDKYKYGDIKTSDENFDIDSFTREFTADFRYRVNRSNPTFEQKSSDQGQKIHRLLKLLKRNYKGVAADHVASVLCVKKNTIYHFLTSNGDIVPKSEVLVFRKGWARLYTKFNLPEKDSRVNRLLYAMREREGISIRDAAVAAFVNKPKEMGEVVALANLLLADKSQMLCVDGSNLVLRSV